MEIAEGKTHYTRVIPHEKVALSDGLSPSDRFKGKVSKLFTER
jgi:hypothetical protein